MFIYATHTLRGQQVVFIITIVVSVVKDTAATPR